MFREELNEIIRSHLANFTLDMKIPRIIDLTVHNAMKTQLSTIAHTEVLFSTKNLSNCDNWL